MESYINCCLPVSAGAPAKKISTNRRSYRLVTGCLQSGTACGRHDRILRKSLYPIAGHRACSNALYYIEVGDLNVPPGWLPALAARGFSVLPEALLETTLSASWLVQAIDESFDPRTACIVTMAWFGLTEGRLQHWARERRLLPHCFLPALYFHGLIFTG